MAKRMGRVGRAKMYGGTGVIVPTRTRSPKAVGKMPRTTEAGKAMLAAVPSARVRAPARGAW